MWRILLIRKRAPRHHLESARISAGLRNSGAKSGFNQPGRVKSVQPAKPRVVVRQVAGQGAQIAVRGDDLGQARDLAGIDRHAAHAGFGRQQRGDRLLAFFRFQRTGAVDQRPARLEQRDRLLQQPLLQRRQGGDVGFLPQPGDVGMAADGAGRGAGRIDQDAVEGAVAARPFGGVGDDVSACSASRARLSRSRAIRGGRTIDRRDTRAGLRQLRGLAAGCGAEIDDGLVR